MRKSSASRALFSTLALAMVCVSRRLICVGGKLHTEVRGILEQKLIDKVALVMVEHEDSDEPTYFGSRSLGQMLQ